MNLRIRTTAWLNSFALLRPRESIPVPIPFLTNNVLLKMKVAATVLALAGSAAAFAPSSNNKVCSSELRRQGDRVSDVIVLLSNPCQRQWICDPE